MKNSGKSGMNNFLVFLTFGITAGALGYALGNPDPFSRLVAGGGASVLYATLNSVLSSVKSFELGKFSEFLHSKICGTTADASLSLQDVFETAFKKAVGRLKSEYHNIGSVKRHNDKEAVDLFFASLIERSTLVLGNKELSIMPTAEFGNFLTGNPNQRRQVLLSKLGVADDLKDMNDDLQSIIQDKLLPYIIDSFWLELKAKGNEPAWREFQRLQQESLNFFIQQIIAKQDVGTELMCQMEHSLTALQADNRLFMEALGYTTTEIKAIRNDLSRIISAGRLDKLHRFKDTHVWIDKNLGGKGTFSPSLEDFIGGRVCVPQQVEKEVTEFLTGGNDVILYGKPASGKTVFGLALAVKQCADESTRSIYYDLRDISSFNMTDILDKAYSDIDLTIEQLGRDFPWEHRILVVLDNVHTAKDYAKSILDYIVEKRETGVEICALLLSRPIQKKTAKRKPLWNMESLMEVELVADAEAFFCVASRLAAKENITFAFDENIVQNWIKQCSVDLIAFAMAFDPMHPDSLDKNEINRIIRKDYLSKANSQTGGIDNFLDLCAINSLDLDFEFGSAWKVYELDEFYPEFSNDMVIETLERSTINPRSYCRLFHPSLASLCLEVQKIHDSKEDKVLRLYKLCQRLPQYLGWALARMKTKEYWSKEEVQRFLTMVKADPSLVLDANAAIPYMHWVYEPMQIPVNWNELMSDAVRYKNLAENLAQTSLDFITLFVKFLDRQTLHSEATEIMHKVLQKPELLRRIKLSPPNFIANFLKSLPVEFKEETEAIIPQILPDSDFRKSLCKSPGDCIVTFLDYLSQTPFFSEVPDLINYLVENASFKQRIISTNSAATTCLLRYLQKIEAKDKVKDTVQYMLDSNAFNESLEKGIFGNHMAFLNFLSEIGYTDKRDAIFRTLLASKSFVETLFTKSIKDSVLPLVKFITINYHEERQAILDGILASSTQESIETSIKKASDVEAASTYAYIRKLVLPEFLSSALLTQAGDKFKEPYPDPLYPQERLLWMSAIGLVELFKIEQQRINRFRVACIVCSLMENIELFEAWLNRQGELDLKYLKQYSETAELTMLQEYFGAKEASLAEEKRDIGKPIS